jgi:hypothetical protein
MMNLKRQDYSFCARLYNWQKDTSVWLIVCCSDLHVPVSNVCIIVRYSDAAMKNSC